MQYDKIKLKNYKLVKQISRAHRNGLQTQVFENKETEAAAEPHRIGEGRREKDEK